MSLRLSKKIVLQQNARIKIGVQFSPVEFDDPREKEEEFVEEDFDMEEFEEFDWEDEEDSEEDSYFDDYSGEEDF
jgi:hypothetical protein